MPGKDLKAQVWEICDSCQNLDLINYRKSPTVLYIKTMHAIHDIVCTTKITTSSPNYIYLIDIWIIQPTIDLYSSCWYDTWEWPQYGAKLFATGNKPPRGLISAKVDIESIVTELPSLNSRILGVTSAGKYALIIHAIWHRILDGHKADLISRHWIGFLRVRKYI